MFRRFMDAMPVVTGLVVLLAVLALFVSAGISGQKIMAGRYGIWYRENLDTVPHIFVADSVKFQLSELALLPGAYRLVVRLENARPTNRLSDTPRNIQVEFVVYDDATRPLKTLGQFEVLGSAYLYVEDHRHPPVMNRIAQTETVTVFGAERHFFRIDNYVFGTHK